MPWGNSGLGLDRGLNPVEVGKESKAGQNNLLCTFSQCYGASLEVWALQSLVFGINWLVLLGVGALDRQSCSGVVKRVEAIFPWVPHLCNDVAWGC